MLIKTIIVLPHLKRHRPPLILTGDCIGPCYNWDQKQMCLAFRTRCLASRVMQWSKSLRCSGLSHCIVVPPEILVQVQALSQPAVPG
jgi:hypothetical protein